MQIDKYSGLIEAMLFYENEVINMKTFKEKTDLSEEKIKEILNHLMEKYNDPLHGISIIEVAEGYTFQIKKEIVADFKQMFQIKEKQKLSKTVMTVLSIIAYKQPITKMEVEDIRGVSSDNAVRLLLEKNLIEIVGRKEALGKPLLYGTSKDFLKHFNLKSIDDLPQINELKSDEFTLEMQEEEE
ncbi:MAG: SMC-Scp complex subunit ScpB [Spirochaetes bacterium]|nr:SMC-Scp complex subunit ScpB [Spirochaetota bacterium]